MSSIDDTINAAIAAANTPAAAAQAAVPALAAGTGTALGDAAPVVNVPRSLEDVAASASATVDAYFKLKFEGIYLGDDKTALDEIKVRVRGSDISLYTAIAYGDPVQYGRTYDGRTEARTGQLWNTFLNNALRMGSKGPYDSADIPFYLVEDFVSQRGDKKGQVVYKKGDVIGYTTSKSAMREFRNFVKSTILPKGQDVLLEGTLKLKAIKTDKGEWGVFDFGSPDSWQIVNEDED